MRNGLGLGRFCRRIRRKQRYISAADLRRSRNGQAVKLAGLVLVRQRPGSARGGCFITVEDETGVANLVVWPRVMADYRKAVMQSRLLAVQGHVQRDVEIVHVVARSLEDRSDALLRPTSSGSGSPMSRAGGIDPRCQRSFRDTRATCELSPQAGTSIEHSGKYWAPIRFWTGIPRRLSERGEEKSMCNLYSNTMPQDAMRRLFSVVDRLGNQAPLAAIFPDDEVPIVRIGTDGGRELVKARWGWDKTPRGWVTNARNLDTNWGVIRNVGQRCLVPATSFAEYHPSETIPGAKGNPIKAATWFRMAGEKDPPAFRVSGLLPALELEGEWAAQEVRPGARRRGCGDARDDVPDLSAEPCRPGDPSAGHVDTQEEFETWLTANGDQAAALQRPLPDEKLAIAFVGAKADELTT